MADKLSWGRWRCLTIHKLFGFWRKSKRTRGGRHCSLCDRRWHSNAAKYGLGT